MWLELRDQLAVEEAQLQQLFKLHLELLAKCRLEEPSAIELSALGAFLHSFYTGIENLFRRVAVEIDDEVPRGEVWHRRILRQMAEPASGRPAFISHELEERLTPYLQFRHVFRQAYSFQLQWQKMAPLVLSSEELFDQLRTEISSFSVAMDEKE